MSFDKIRQQALVLIGCWGLVGRYTAQINSVGRINHSCPAWTSHPVNTPSAKRCNPFPTLQSKCQLFTALNRMGKNGKFDG